MPSLNKVKEAAKKIQCQSQQRQYAFAITMYQGDNDQDFPFFGDEFSPSKGGGAEDPNTMWFNVLAPYMGEKRVTDMDYSQFLTDVRRCPSGKRDTSQKWLESCGYWNGWIGVNYAGSDPLGAPFNYGRCYGNDVLPCKLTNIREPATWISLIDVQDHFVAAACYPCWYLDDDMDGDDEADTCSAQPFIYNRANPKLHNNGCNITLCDGHIEWIKFEELWESNTIGQFVHDYWYDSDKYRP